MRRHVVLIGLPGSGKSTAGRLAAELLGAPHVDLDRLVERRAGAPVTRIFAEYGEATFRKFEREAMADALESEPSVIAPGGGWAAQPGALEWATPACAIIYLVCPAAVAARRAAAEGGRPLLAGGDPEKRMKELLAERAEAYDRAPHRVDAARAPAEVAKSIAEVARREAGW
jgi:shikimate kinase